MDNLYSKITEKEHDMIQFYRTSATEDEYGSTYSKNATYCSNEFFLRYWSREKAANPMISKIFQDELILTTHINTQISRQELLEKADAVMSNYYREREFIVEALEYFNQDTMDSPMVYWEGHRNYNFWNGDKEENCYWTPRDIMWYFFFTSDNAADNVYHGPKMTFVINAEGKKYELNDGAKFAKAIGKLATAVPAYFKARGYEPCNYAESRFEQWRIKLSSIRNTSSFNTKLCLSIHPLDYLTASENNNDWRSCMNVFDGEYRRGIIEMMNSPFVVVAYTPSEHENLNPLAGCHWNSKKWREFFIIDPNSGIFGIKGYPYWNENLENATISWIISMLGSWQFKDIESFQYNKSGVRMHCGPAMYNDFYGSNKYQRAMLRGIDDENFSIYYSGASICCVCGSEGEFDNEGAMICGGCYEYHYCCMCNEMITNEDYSYELNGREYCSSCYENLPVCQSCDNVFDDNLDDEFEGARFAIGLSDNAGGFVHDPYRPRNAHEICLCSDCGNHFMDDFEGAIRDASKRVTSWWQFLDLVKPSRFKSWARLEEVLGLTIDKDQKGVFGRAQYLYGFDTDSAEQQVS